MKNDENVVMNGWRRPREVIQGGKEKDEEKSETKSFHERLQSRIARRKSKIGRQVGPFASERSTMPLKRSTGSQFNTVIGRSISLFKEFDSSQDGPARQELTGFEGVRQ